MENFESNSKHLTKEERYYIECRKASEIDVSLRQIARELKRCHTRISREIKRNTDIDFGFYSGIRAVERKSEVQKNIKIMIKISDQIKV